jgi:hypothetical protein
VPLTVSFGFWSPEAQSSRLEAADCSGFHKTLLPSNRLAPAVVVAAEAAASGAGTGRAI